MRYLSAVRYPFLCAAISLLAATAAAQCGPQWAAVPVGPNGSVSAMAEWDPDGPGPLPPRLVIGGSFTAIGGVPIRGIAMWDGATWLPFGSGVQGGVLALLPHPSGDLYVGGQFVTAGGQPANYIARWDGTTWSPLGSGATVGFFMGSPISAIVRALTALPNGDVVAGGDFVGAGGVICQSVARWNGSSWFAMGTGMVYGGFPFTAQVHALATLGNGDVVAAGRFLTAGGANASAIARWNGTSWSPIGGGINGLVECLRVLGNGDLIAAGNFGTAGGQPANCIARWDGVAWSALATGLNSDISALTELPSGDLVVAGSFTQAGTLLANYIARWNGTNWSPFNSASTVGTPAYSILRRPDGSLLVGGNFATVNIGGVPTPTACLAKVLPSCPATATTYGVGCAGPGGALQLQADALPWMSTTFAATGTGFGAGSLGFAMMSLGQLLPGAFPLHPGLVGIVPGPGVGCDLLVASLGVSSALLPAAGTVHWSLPIGSLPANPTLPGRTFYLQVAELDLSAGWIGTYTTNGLACTIGSF